jgi:hypothetical protein
MGLPGRLNGKPDIPEEKKKKNDSKTLPGTNARPPVPAPSAKENANKSSKSSKPKTKKAGSTPVSSQRSTENKVEREYGKKIYISYHRTEDEKSGIVDIIYNNLTIPFGKVNVFRDAKNIEPGSDWRARLNDEIRSCNIMLVVIGPDWAGPANAGGQNRLFDPSDITRWEVERGILRARDEGLVLIPVLVLGAAMPTARELPGSLYDLLSYKSMRIRNYPDIEQDFEKLIAVIQSPDLYPDRFSAKPMATVKQDRAKMESNIQQNLANLEASRSVDKDGESVVGGNNDLPTMEVHEQGDAAGEGDVAGQPWDDPEAESAKRLRAAREANLLANNRSQAVFNDQAQGEDQLGIKNEVEALAETLLLRDVEPPIAVGIMGGWGSGKSFVMYLISRYVEATRAKLVKKGWPDPEKNQDADKEKKKDKDPDIPAYVGHIYQINFNAWTYAKSNLWASLMDTIFTCLNRQMQLERLFAYQGILEAEELPMPEVVNSCLMGGGDIFRKIYRDDYQIDLDTDLGDLEKKNLNFWSERLLSHNLLWQVMRNQNEAALQVMREDEQELEKYKARRALLEQAHQTESVVVSELDGKISRPAYFALLQTTLLSLVSDSLSKTTRDELKKSDLDPAKLEGLKKETETLIKGSRGLFYAVGKNKYFWAAGLSVAILTLAFSYIWGLFGKSFVAQVITPAIALLSALAPFYPTLLTRWRNILEYETKTKKAFEDALEAQRTKVAEDIAAENITYAEKVKKLEDEVKTGSLPACDVLIRMKENRIEQQRRKIGPAAKYATLMEFVQSRLDSATYENQLGLMHQVRRDIDELTYSLVSSANTTAFPRGKPRVILYIDDLDRCPPSRVVEILEAVQLLLNTKLFVVILGLDTRYVTRALEKEYKEILQHEGDPSGLDYIEKIIQIPYRVRPIERQWLHKYLEMQMDVEQPPEPEAPSSQQVQAQPVQPSSIAQDPSSGGIQTQADTASQTSAPPEHSQNETAPAEPTMSDHVEESKLPEIELPAAVIQFKPTDLVDLNACCEQVSLTPRSIKRVVNVFKLMKIFWFRADKMDQSRSVKQASICLLALSSAYPEVMREVFVHLESLYRRSQEHMRLAAALNNIKLPPGSAHELAWQFQSYKQAVATLKSMPGDEEDPLDQLTLDQLKFSTFNIVRSFSFVGDPVYWTDDEEDKGRANGHVPVRRAVRVNRN